MTDDGQLHMWSYATTALDKATHASRALVLYLHGWRVPRRDAEEAFEVLCGLLELYNDERTVNVKDDPLPRSSGTTVEPDTTCTVPTTESGASGSASAAKENTDDEETPPR